MTTSNHIDAYAARCAVLSVVDVWSRSGCPISDSGQTPTTVTTAQPVAYAFAER